MPRSRAPRAFPSRSVNTEWTHIQCTPSKTRLLLAEAPTRDALSTLRTVLVGGEALTADVVAALQEATAADILNIYGPTENDCSIGNPSSGQCRRRATDRPSHR